MADVDSTPTCFNWLAFIQVPGKVLFL